MQKRFGFLRFTSFMLRLFAAICLLLGLAAGLALILGGNYQNVLGFKLTIPTAALWIAALLPVVCGLFYFVILCGWRLADVAHRHGRKHPRHRPGPGQPTRPGAGVNA
ncbi:MAG: hypothetical protein IPM84_21900 [Anaerolineae bacterium]|nr:hypothetical protein [Anaerolineae bacterium]